MSVTVRMWRCERCGRWSHAQRKPASHLRTVRAEDVPGSAFGTEPDEVIVDTHQVMESDTGAWVIAAWTVRCGPFAAWDATRARVR